MQMRYVLLPFLGALCLALAACSVTYGNKSVASPEVYGRLAPGKSSKADVYDALGQPSDVVTMKNGVLWTYRYRKAKNDFLGNIPPLWRRPDCRREKRGRLYGAGPV